jgi:hypothetical protein
MKTTLFFLVMSCSAISMHAQSQKFISAMLSNLEVAKSATTLEEYQQLANNFERIANAEQTEWTAWYYAAFYNLVINFQDSVTDRKEKFIALAQQQIENGLKAKPEESEFLVLKVMSYFAEMAIDPMKGMTLLGEANALISQAKSINPDNPRIYLEEAEAVYNMPPEFGGGKEKALPILLLAREKFNKFVPADQLAPNWGRDRCEMLLGGIEKSNEL